MTPKPPNGPGEAVVAMAQWAVGHRWEAALRRADSTTGTIDERVTALRRAFARELTTVGAAVGAAAAMPVVGTIAVVGASMAELGVLTFRQCDLILTIAAVHGHTQASVEDRLAWVLSIIAFGDTANIGFARVAGEVGKGLGAKATARIPTESLRQINRALGRTVVTKYGTKRGAVAIGRVLPFGIGAAIGGSSNYALTRLTVRQAASFFRLLPPAAPTYSRA